MKLEGITFFAERPGVSYRYFIELKNSRMSIWMEDRKNKTQYQQDALERLEKEVKHLRADQEPIFIQLKASRKHETTSNLCWDKQESVSFIVNKGSGEIKITRSGVYSIHGTWIYYPIDDDGRMMLLKNKECILTVDILDSLNYVERLEKGDVLEHWRMDLLLEHGTGKW
ncbi:hypothetical protein JG687_00010543 [Phytophthora cactorum]|uniref:Uncharacterized protein n=1 Tax=Phytophthora cactorum TaxID=29920 RepID=A0A8T1U6J5_9STRA|nr:hypothetical protein JG687_00010543 [Phytophthora cactorum]